MVRSPPPALATSVVGIELWRRISDTPSPRRRRRDLVFRGAERRRDGTALPQTYRSVRRSGWIALFIISAAGATAWATRTKLRRPASPLPCGGGSGATLTSCICRTRPWPGGGGGTTARAFPSARHLRERHRRAGRYHAPLCLVAVLDTAGDGGVGKAKAQRPNRCS